MIIIIEGPDNGGKTTLAQAIAKDMKAVYVKVERPRRAVDLVAYQGILETARNYSGVVVSDRHVAISEPIYGNIIRGGHELRQADIELCLQGINALIYCRPPEATILGSIADRAQMEGVIENTSRIIQAYDEWMNDVWHEHRFPFYSIYNYRRDSVAELIANLKTHQGAHHAG